MGEAGEGVGGVFLKEFVDGADVRWWGEVGVLERRRRGGGGCGGHGWQGEGVC